MELAKLVESIIAKFVALKAARLAKKTFLNLGDNVNLVTSLV